MAIAIDILTHFRNEKKPVAWEIMSLLTNSTIMDRFEYSDILGYDYEEEVDDVDFQLLN